MHPLDAAVPALLFRQDRNPFHHGSLGAARSLGRAGVDVHAFVESPDVPLARSRYLRGAHPFPSGRGAEPVRRALERAARRIGRRAVLIPMDDHSALALDGLGDALRERFLLPARAGSVAARLADKARLAAVCRELGLPHPTTAVPGDAAEAAAAARELGWPLIAKWSRPWLLPEGCGLRSTAVVTGPDQLSRLFARRAEAGGPLVLQRLIPGGHDADWFFHGCFGAGGRLLLGGTGRKELSWPPRAGLTAVGSWVPRPELEEAARRLAGRMGYQGILDLDFRRDAGTGAYHLLDANPRPGAQFRLFTDRAGLDVVRALHLHLTGREVPVPAPAPGRMFVAENYGPLSAVLSRRLPRPRRGGGVEAAWFAADDPAPFLAMASGTLRRAARRGRRCGDGVAVPARPGRPTAEPR